MKELALQVFRQPPDRLNCAQSVLYAWRAVFGDTTITIPELKPVGAGRAPEGLCGAIYAACLLAPDRAEVLKTAFAARVGNMKRAAERTDLDMTLRRAVNAIYPGGRAWFTNPTPSPPVR